MGERTMGAAGHDMRESQGAVIGEVDEVPGVAGSAGTSLDGSEPGDISVVVDGLTIRAANGQELAGPVTFRMAAGSVTALTGPSGSGKTTLMRALLGHLPSGSVRAAGSVTVAGHDVFALDSGALQRFRRSCIAYAGQDPGSALNPMMRVHSLLGEVARGVTRDAMVETLELVGLSAEHLRRRPGGLSGGQQRRVALARALLRNTAVLVFDEPLAGLHGALRTDIAHLLTEIATERSVAILLSGHDTALVHVIADQAIELGLSGSPRPSTSDRNTTHAARMLDLTEADRDEPPQSREIRLCATGIGASIDGYEVLREVDLQVSAGAAVAVVGASGAGKTTLARVLAGLHQDATGSLQVRGEPIPVGGARRLGNGGSWIRLGRGTRRGTGRRGPGHQSEGGGVGAQAGVVDGGLPFRPGGGLWPGGNGHRGGRGGNGIQLVTQNPLSALNPRRTVAQTLGRPLRRFGKVPKRDVGERVRELLGAVELAPDLAGRYPHELSGGQRQRVSLARALAAEPAVLICDEITSALDHETAAAIMGLLDRICIERGTALVVITHDMSLAAAHCAHIVVLDHGRVVESGDTATVLAAPTHNATRELLG
ncbi:ABC transporter ATP-binding protein [Nocardia sp. NPDC052566]|uniref:ABC transporter ATP-binding protein n=1 Tax=Nocardia sp. NPDC052566 TaxID=3364330 RepID=UPI0037CB45BA